MEYSYLCPDFFLRSVCMKKLFLLILCLMYIGLLFAQAQILINKYGWHLNKMADGHYVIRDSARIAGLCNMEDFPVSHIPYQPNLLSKDSISNDQCSTSSWIYTTSNGHELRLEVDLPKGDGPFPFVLYIHGGGWGAGDLNVFRPHSRFLASHRIAGVRISYSLIKQGGTFDLVEEEIDKAIQFVKANSQVLQLDTTKWGVAGGSAGAQLGSIAALRHEDCRFFIGFYGTYDLRHRHSGDFPSDSLCKTYLGGNDDPMLRKASAVNYLDRSTQLPHVLLVHGTADLTISVGQSKNFADQIRKRGGNVEEVYYEGYGHSFTNPLYADRYDTVIHLMLAYVSRQL